MAFRDSPSLGTMTGTRVDSATKHVRTCRVSEDFVSKLKGSGFGSFTLDNADVSKYMIYRDDLFIGCKPSCHATQYTASMKKAYTVGISSLVGLDTWGKLCIILKTMYCYTEEDLCKMIEVLRSHATPDLKKALEWIPDFFCFGMALTDGHPSGNFGDTALSVQTGGMATLSNGPFYVNCSDILTWVWEFELPFLYAEKNSVFVDRDISNDDINDPDTYENANALSNKTLAEIFNACMFFLQLDTLARFQYEEFFNGMNKLLTRRHQHRGSAIDYPTSKKNVQLRTSLSGVQSKNDRIGFTPRIIPLPVNATHVLRKRSFGKSMGVARPWDSLDIMISRQGL